MDSSQARMAKVYSTRDNTTCDFTKMDKDSLLTRTEWCPETIPVREGLFTGARAGEYAKVSNGVGQMDYSLFSESGWPGTMEVETPEGLVTVRLVLDWFRVGVAVRHLIFGMLTLSQ